MFFCLGCVPHGLDPSVGNSHQEDFEAYAQLLRTQWANRDVRERLDNVSLESRIQSVQNFLAFKSLASDQEFYLLLNSFTRLLHDGHLYNIYPEARGVSLVSGLTLAKVKEGLALIKCQRESCEDLDLPMLVTKIDNQPTDTWIQSKVAQVGNSTHSGREHQLLKQLSHFTGLQGEEAILARHLELQDKRGAKQNFAIEWSAAPEPIAPTEPDCVSGDMNRDVFVLRVRTFLCRKIGEENPELWRQRFSRQLRNALKERAHHANRVLIDLRGNRGGMPQEALELAGLFVSRQTLYYRSRLQNSEDRTIHDTWINPDATAGHESLLQMPLSLLIDGGCFSQCSLFALALRDAKRARLLGAPLDSGAGGGMSEIWTAPSGKWRANVPPWEVYGMNHGFIEGRSTPLDQSLIPPLKDFTRTEDPVLQNALNTP